MAAHHPQAAVGRGWGRGRGAQCQALCQPGWPALTLADLPLPPPSFGNILSPYFTPPHTHPPHPPPPTHTHTHPQLLTAPTHSRSELDKVILPGSRLPALWGQTPGAFPRLTLLSVADSHLQGPLPREWGQPGAFPRLSTLTLTGNGLSGTLPPEWCRAGAWPELTNV